MFVRGCLRVAASVSLVAIALVLGVAGDAGAQTAPTASPSASASPPRPAATPRRLGLHVSANASATLIDQDTAGPGQTPPEGAGFVAGSPLAPNTPYDLLSSAPQTPGVAQVDQLYSTATYGLHAYDVSLTSALGYVDGSTTNAAYWGENLIPTLNPHLGSQALPYRIAFPTHPGEDDATAFRLSILGASFATADGNLRVRGGWFDLAQTDRFVFAQPALTSVDPQIAYAPAESLTNGVASASFWAPDATQLPLQGLDVVAKRGDATFEATDADLASLPGESARLRMASIVLDRGEGTRFSAQILHATTGGLSFDTTVPFGIDPQFTPTPQGVLPTSFLNGQRETMLGLRGAFHLLPAQNVDGLVEVGRSWYDASPVAEPGTQAPGGFYHVGFVKTLRRVTASLDWYRMEPRYATIILPYGVAENQWSSAFAWPGQWLKSNYQLIDNSVLGVNRQGYRLRYYVDKGPLEVHLEYTDLRQIDPETTATALQAGYVDGYYLPELPDAATFGRQKRYALWTAWHPSFGDLSLDVVDDTLYRPFDPGHVDDQVSYEVPQAVLTYSRTVSANVTAAAGLGRYAVKGAFSEPLDFSQRLFFLGTQVEETPRSSLQITFRRTAFGGSSTAPRSDRSPDFTGSTIVLEQRFKIY